MSEAVPAVLGLLAELRARCGVLKAKKKDGVKFRVRSAEELNDKMRAHAIDLGLLIYPIASVGQGYPVEDGTLAAVNLVLRIQAVADGSYVDVAGFGLGADGQDKAGGKAGTYAWKAALVQTLLAGGADDTDDTDTPISGGVKKRGAGRPTVQSVREAFDGAGDELGFKAALAMGSKLTPDEQKAVADAYKAARSRLGLATPAPTQH
jgi:hypothetical protein